MSSSVVSYFFTLQNNIKLFHWHTKSFAKHKASDELHSSLLSLIDSFIEIYFGKYERQYIQKKDAKIELENMTSERFIQFLREATTFLKTMKLDPKNDTDLLNIRDEMLSVIYQTIYLCSLE